MTWRAFIIGLVAVACISLIDPYAAFIRQYGALNSTAFPASSCLVLVVLSVVVNALIKLVRRGWALKKPELMLVWCMMICSATIPSFGIGRFLFSLIAGPAYQARRPDVHWEDGGALTHAPAGLLLSKDPLSEAVRQYHEGGVEGGRVPWRLWMGPLTRWALFLLLLYLAVFFLCAILRRQWVESDRLMFPLARVPLEFSEGSDGPGLLPAVLRSKPFLVGLAAAMGLRLLRATPLFFGAEQPIMLIVPLREVFVDTALEHARFDSVPFWPRAMGFAFLVPADVSLSVWFFFLVSRAELATAHWLALPYRGGELMSWQQAGTYLAFAAGLVILARRHLAEVVRKALAPWRGTEDGAEPVGYAVAFWGLVAALGGCVLWYKVHGMRVSAAVALLTMMFCSFVVYARVVAQGGVHVSRPIWGIHHFLHGISGGHLFGKAGAVIASMQSTLLLTGGSVALAPMAINAFRIADVFPRRRRLLLPALLVGMAVALACTSYTVLTHAYDEGVLSFSDPWGQQQVPRWRFAEAQRMIATPAESARPCFAPLVGGAVAMALVTFMRARFYWWPIHPIGMLAVAGFHAQRLWLPFLCGWLTKVLIMRYGGGRRLRAARLFFIALILSEAFTDGLSTVISAATDGAVPLF